MRTCSGNNFYNFPRPMQLGFMNSYTFTLIVIDKCLILCPKPLPNFRCYNFLPKTTSKFYLSPYYNICLQAHQYLSSNSTTGNSWPHTANPNKKKEIQFKQTPITITCYFANWKHNIWADFDILNIIRLIDFCCACVWARI